MNITFITLGCRANQSESAGMAELLRRRGHSIVLPGEDADAVVVNTCTVTATADKKSRSAIRRLRARYPDAVLAVCGCLPQTEELNIEGIDLLGGTTDRAGFAVALDKMLASGDRGRSAVFLPNPDPDDTGDTMPDARSIGRSRAYIKIQDGCDNRCAYCKVPLARGRSRSRAVKSSVEAAVSAADGGASEIVLTGIEISSFRPSLAEVTAEVCRAIYPVPARLSSLHPNIIGDMFINRLKAEKNFLPKFHLSLQSVCDKILAAMGRRYTVADIYAAVGLIRGAWADAAVTADIIVGFPGESGEDFEQTYRNLQTLKPDGLHIFPYSRRKGTAAYDMPAQLTRQVKAERAKRLSAAFPKKPTAL